MVIPSGIYTDLGATGLRQMLFSQTQISGLFGFENRKKIFEGVDSRFKFIVLTFSKGGETKQFPATFMRHDVAELEQFPDNALMMSLDLVRRLSPETLSLMEFGHAIDIQIAEKMTCFPMLGEEIEGVWNLSLTAEFHMTNDSNIFKTEDGPQRLPLLTGKMFHQFRLTDKYSGYWIDESDGRSRLLGKTEDNGQPLDYQGYRWLHRRIARNTDSRTLITTITPKYVFTEVNSTTIKVLETGITSSEMLFLCAITNSFVLDWYIRQKVTTTLNMFYLYQLPVPRLTAKDSPFAPIVERAAKLICTTPAFDELAHEVGLGAHANGVTDENERAKLRAELDGLIAHLYALSLREFKHILSSFPIVDDATKEATLEAYRQLAPNPEVLSLIASGESERVEFKEGTIRNPHTGKRDDKMRHNIVKAVAALMNTPTGGTLLIGVHDNGSITGIELEYPLANKQKANWDGYELFLADVLNKSLSIPIPFTFYTISRHPIQSFDICRIQVRHATQPVYVQNKLYVRSGAQSKELQGADLIAYVQKTWGK